MPQQDDFDPGQLVLYPWELTVAGTLWLIVVGSAFSLTALSAVLDPSEFFGKYVFGNVVNLVFCLVFLKAALGNLRGTAQSTNFVGSLGLGILIAMMGVFLILDGHLFGFAAILFGGLTIAGGVFTLIGWSRFQNWKRSRDGRFV